jgi:hypothetical protein
MTLKGTTMNDRAREDAFNRSEDSRPLTVESVDSVALARLIEEVRNEGAGPLGSPTAYNRTYHRHNR